MDPLDRYEIISRLTGTALWEYDVATGSIRCDASLMCQLGFDADRQLTRDEWIAAIHPNDRERILLVARGLIECRWNARHADQRSPGSPVRLRGTGPWRWFRVAFEIHSRAAGVLVAVLTDATIDLRERFAERSAERGYRDVWHSIPSAAVILDVTGRIVDANPAWHDAALLAGAPRSAFVGESYVGVLERAIASGDASAAQALDGIRRVLRFRDRRFTLDYECSPPGGERRWYRMNVFALERPTRGAVVFHWDITAPRVVDLALHRERDHLTHMQRLSTMNELATSIAHELNQPLATITACASTARRIVDGEPSAELRPIVDDILEAAMRAAQVVRGARAMVRRRSSEREPLDLNEVVAAVTRLAASDLLIHQITLTMALAEHMPVIIGDRIQLQQVVLNLLLNAIDAVADQPRERRSIRITTSYPVPDRVELVVADSGAGVAPEIAKRLFDPFMTTKQEGTGLGLAIVRAVVEAHGGRVAAFTPTDSGAAFRVSLPYENSEDSNSDFALSSIFASVAARNR
jgi:signal transduction histidine kinase